MLAFLPSQHRAELILPPPPFVSDSFRVHGCVPVAPELTGASDQLDGIACIGYCRDFQPFFFSLSSHGANILEMGLLKKTSAT